MSRGFVSERSHSDNRTLSPRIITTPNLHHFTFPEIAENVVLVQSCKTLNRSVYSFVCSDSGGPSSYEHSRRPTLRLEQLM